jgi:peptidylprolyl isomerase/peptidyl-prolyl cis-trans isomerase D
MRDSMPVILFGLLIAFLITIVFEWGMDYLGMRGGGQSDVIGKVNGHKITYKEFSELVKTLSDNAKTQTGQEPDESMQPQLRERGSPAARHHGERPGADRLGVRGEPA